MNRLAVFALLLLVPTPAVAQEPKGNTVAVDFGLGADQSAAESGIATGSQLIEVVATGVGADPEQALQNAFSHAIEQAVGVLVDAEAIVENDQLISDNVLTFSRGYVKNHDVVRRWQDEGLHYARIRALVEMGKLGEKLKTHRVPVRPMDGERIVLQVIHDVQSDQNAAEMFRKAIGDCTIDRLTKVEIQGPPEILEKDAVTAKLLVKVNVASDFEKWKLAGPKLELLLEKIASDYSGFSVVNRPNTKDRYGFGVGGTEDRRLGSLFKGADCRVCLFKGVNPPGTTTLWKAFAVSKSLSEELAQLGLRKYRLCVVLLDEGGSLILRHERLLAKNPGMYIEGRLTVVPRNLNNYYGRTFHPDYAIGPLIFDAFGHEWFYQRKYTFEETIGIDLDKLRRVRSCSAYIEEIPAD